MTYIDFLKPYERELLRAIKKKGPVITVSGLSGSGKDTVANITSELTGLKIFTGGMVFREMAKKKGMTIEEFCIKRDKNTDYELDKLLLKKGLEGNVILNSRLAGWIMGEHADIKIFVECPLEIRARRIAERDGVSEEEARKSVRKRDEADTQRYKQLYSIDINKKDIYDVVIDNRDSLIALRKEVILLLRERGFVS